MSEGPMGVVAFIGALAIFFVLRRCKIQIFLALLCAAFAAGLGAGLDPVRVTQIVAGTFGGTVEKMGIMLVAGAIIGVALERSGAACVIVENVLKKAAKKRPLLVLSVLGCIVSVPVFCEAGFVQLVVLQKMLVKRTGIAAAAAAAALSTGLYAAYILVPPTPGPLAAAGVLGADLRVLMVLAIFTAVPAVAVGYLWAVRYAAGHEAATENAVSYDEMIAGYPQLPGTMVSYLPILLPLLLIAVKATANFPGIPCGQGWVKLCIDFAGEPMVALLLGVGACMFLAVEPVQTWSAWVNEGVLKAAPIVLVTAAGGALGGMLTAAGTGIWLVMLLQQHNLGIFLPFAVAGVLKTMHGSSMAALITTSAVIFPLLNSLGAAGPYGAVLATLAAGAGAMTCSHVNDTYFWIVSQFSGLDAETVLKTYGVATLFMGLSAMAVVWLFSLWLL